MSDKSFCTEVNGLASGSQDKNEQVIPNGEKWIVTKLGGCASKTADGESITISLKWGTEVKRKFNVNGNSFEIDMKKGFIGDGSKKITVRIKNNTSETINGCYWCDRFKEQ